MVENCLAPELSKKLAGRWEPVYRSQLHYLVTWGTRGRKPVLKERHVRRLQDLVRHVCDERGAALLEVCAGNDHVHVLLAIRPSQSIASVIRELKGRAALALLAECPELRVWLRGNLLWEEAYSVETVSGVRVPRVQARLRSLHANDQDLARAS